MISERAARRHRQQQSQAAQLAQIERIEQEDPALTARLERARAHRQALAWRTEPLLHKAIRVAVGAYLCLCLVSTTAYLLYCAAVLVAEWWWF